MTFLFRQPARLVAAALLATAVTQVFYVAVVADAEGETLRRITWLTELALYTVPAAAGIVMAARDKAFALTWAVIALGGLVNVVQVAMGLAMFGPAMAGGEGAVFQTVLQGAFFLYFYGKALFGLAAVRFGMAALSGGLLAKGLGAVGIVSGGAAMILNGVAMASGMEWAQAAGAAGTLATAMLAVLMALSDRTPTN